ncbi:hypothetical protein KOM00_18355 [Geomonas sp. Red69]|uniref:hypothetical protein n=1 Tax=Geomonas diazotrophica TaxID=2843197 RepID=UPI001C1052BA|nr:hypothetical protein [Geomonas diazotrophica]MBU5638694.1 hypothetical protein [Geomonas diazotrophica]
MCIPWKRHIAAALLLLVLPLLLIGCGGGGGGATRIVSGVATKGPIVGGLVSVYRLALTGARGGLLGTGVTGTDGSYAVRIPASVTGPIVVTVTGQPGATYLSETTGLQRPFTAADSFSAAVDTANPASVTVSPLTEAAFQKLPSILAQKPVPITTALLQSAVLAANARVGVLFNVTDILAPPAGNPAYVAALTVIDQMIVDSQVIGAVTDTTAVTTIINQAVLDVASPAYATFKTLFISAANRVLSTKPELTNLVNSLIQTISNPPAEPNYSDVTAPSVVTGLTAVTYALDATTSAVVLSWNPSTDNIAVAGYNIYRDGVKVGTSTTTSFTDTPVTSNVTYSYTVVAFDAAGNFAAPSAALSVKPNQASLNVTVSGTLSGDLLSHLDIAAPTAPTSLTAVATAITGTISSVALSWTAATDNVGVTGYDVYRDGVKLATVASTTYTDPAVTSATTYSYTVKAFDAAGNRSAFSTALSVTPSRPSLGVTVSGQVNTGP